MCQEKQKYDTLLLELEHLKSENARLKELLHANGITYEVATISSDEEKIYSDISFPDAHLGKDGRVELFRSLFRGRDDVFARRWYSKTTNKGGYQPVCINEWRRGICDKKAVKCADCPNRNFLPLGYDEICKHLIGDDENGCDVIGIYAIMQDNNCAFLCTDFDDKSCKHGYKDDVLAFVGVCRDWGIPYSIERSRSGNGAHVWIFFSEVIPAYKARRLGNAILTEAMSRDGRMAFNSYDRFFPNQDRMPEGGFGNLVALPLQGRARKELNSVFVDDEFLAYRDHIVILGKCANNKEKALFYVHKTLENQWSRAMLLNMMGDKDGNGGLYEAQGKALTNFAETLPKPDTDLARDILKDPYNPQFLRLYENYLVLQPAGLNHLAQVC